ncbi:MAG: hypothetical protein KGJ89_02660 [Patescibacteria group bacterium]|nr:hypothetical protein [Patescibacteria group bacterium]MDE2015780.1 hypothetical protein [Patescibacteria group bacterium]MDE2226837.1 hypothetical protein [Patescibacteria group bacterium]
MFQSFLPLVQNNWFIFLMIAWTLPWKGVALWKAARLRDKWWFIVMLILNTAAVLEIVYIFFVSKRKGLLDKAFSS